MKATPQTALLLRRTGAPSSPDRTKRRHFLCQNNQIIVLVSKNDTFLTNMTSEISYSHLDAISTQALFWKIWQTHPLGAPR
jgi:hypothetical protein